MARQRTRQTIRHLLTDALRAGQSVADRSCLVCMSKMDRVSCTDGITDFWCSRIGCAMSLEINSDNGDHRWALGSPLGYGVAYCYDCCSYMTVRAHDLESIIYDCDNEKCGCILEISEGKCIWHNTSDGTIIDRDAK